MAATGALEAGPVASASRLAGWFHSPEFDDAACMRANMSAKDSLPIGSADRLA